MRKGGEKKEQKEEEKNEKKEEERNEREREKLKAMSRSYFSVNHVCNKDWEKYSRVLNCMLNRILSFLSLIVDNGAKADLD